MERRELAETFLWIDGHSDTLEKRRAAAAIVAWECVATTLNDLVKLYNDIKGDDSLAYFRRIQVKKQIVGMLHETRECLTFWKGCAYVQQLKDAKIRGLERDFKIAFRTLGISDARNIRNELAFHSKDSFDDVERFLELLEKVDVMPIQLLQNAIDASRELGYAIRDELYTVAPPFRVK